MRKAILVGLGGRGRSWIQVCRRAPSVEIVGFVEVAEEVRNAAAAEFSLPGDRMYAALTEALGELAADFCLDVTPPGAHEGVARAAFEAGLHVLQEKPLSDEWDAARRAVEAANRSGRTYMITQNYRFGPVPRATRAALEAGAIGRPEQATMGFYRAWATRPGTHYTTMAFPLLKDMGIHHFDLLRCVLAQEPVAVRASTWNPSWGWHAGDAAHCVEILFDGGCRAIHHACGASVGRQSPWNGELRIEGERGSLTWEEDRVFVTTGHPQEAVRREEIPLPPTLPAQEACLAEFLSALDEGREPECSGNDNLRSLAIVFAAVRSAQTGETVPIARFLSP